MTRYMPYYCEENIWWLCQEPRFAGCAREVVFISNDARSCALFCQTAAVAPGLPVVWDYHVVLAARGQAGVELWDLDCTLGMPLPARRWLEETFGPASSLPDVFLPRFRVIDADDFAARFSSDRGHMLTLGGPLAPPPPWPRIGEGPSNLARFIDMQRPFLGDVVDLAELERRWGCR